MFSVFPMFTGLVGEVKLDGVLCVLIFVAGAIYLGCHLVITCAV